MSNLYIHFSWQTTCYGRDFQVNKHPSIFVEINLALKTILNSKHSSLLSQEFCIWHIVWHELSIYTVCLANHLLWKRFSGQQTSIYLFWNYSWLEDSLIREFLMTIREFFLSQYEAQELIYKVWESFWTKVKKL